MTNGMTHLSSRMQTPSPSTVVSENPFAPHLDRFYLDMNQMPYHGRSHVDEVRRNAAVLVERCKEAGIGVDEVALERAISMHDALMHVHPRWLGLPSAEALAGEVARNFMLDRGYAADEAEKVKRIILATNPMVVPSSTEEIIIRAADLASVGAADYQIFRAANFRLHREAELAAAPEELPPDRWMVKGYAYLQKFLWPMLELTSQARDSEGRSRWHINAMENMTRLWREVVAVRGRVVAEVFDSQFPPRVPCDKNGVFTVYLHPDSAVRQVLVTDQANVSPNQRDVSVVIPGHASALALPDATCDQVTITGSELSATREAFRVLKEDGVLVVRLEDNTWRGSAPTPPGFVYESVRVVEGALFVAFVKDTRASSGRPLHIEVG